MKKLLSIKDRDGGRSASLLYPVPVRNGRRTEKVRRPVGAIRVDDDGKSAPFDTGFIRFADGYSIDLLNDADLVALRAWLSQAAAKQAMAGSQPRVTLAGIDAKVDELLGLARCGSLPGVPSTATGPVAPAVVTAPVYVLPDGAVPGETDEARLLRLLRTFNAAAAEIAPMMPKSAGVFHVKYKFKQETVDEVERSWVLSAGMDKRLNGRGQLKRTGPREEQAYARFGTAESKAEADDADDAPAA